MALAMARTAVVMAEHVLFAVAVALRFAVIWGILLSWLLRTRRRIYATSHC